MAALPPILAVDDSPDDLFFLKRLLTKAGVSNLLITLEDGLQARAFLSGLVGHPDSPIMPVVMFTDLKMPILGGINLVKWVRSEAAFEKLPIVMFSSSLQPEDIAKAKAAGVNEYYQKFPLPETFSKIMTTVGKRKADSSH